MKSPVHSFVVRIYRRDGNSSVLVGTVEGASLKGERGFSGGDELLEILSGAKDDQKHKQSKS